MVTRADLGTKLFEKLIRGNVLKITNDEQFELTSEFDQIYTETESELFDSSNSDIEDIVFEISDEISPYTISLDTLAIVVALSKVEVELSDRELLGTGLLLNQIREGGFDRGGIPAGFLPLKEDDIDLFLELYPVAVIYCWRHDCEPCDTVSHRLEDLVNSSEIPSEIGLGAVYAPENSHTLYSKYNVIAAPTTLFCLNGKVDSRYVGPRSKEALTKEIEVIYERSSLKSTEM